MSDDVPVKFGTPTADGVEMDMLMAGLGTLLNAFFLALIVAAVMKLFQIQTTLSEIKDELSKGRPYVPVAAPPVQSYQPYSAPASAPVGGDSRSGEEMLRELDAQLMLEEARRRGGLNPR